MTSLPNSPAPSNMTRVAPGLNGVPILTGIPPFAAYSNTHPSPRHSSDNSMVAKGPMHYTAIDADSTVLNYEEGDSIESGSGDQA